MARVTDNEVPYSLRDRIVVLEPLQAHENLILVHLHEGYALPAGWVWRVREERDVDGS